MRWSLSRVLAARVGRGPGLALLNSQLTTYAMWTSCVRGIIFVTLRQRNKNVLDALAKLPTLS